MIFMQSVITQAGDQPIKNTIGQFYVVLSLKSEQMQLKVVQIESGEIYEGIFTYNGLQQGLKQMFQNIEQVYNCLGISIRQNDMVCMGKDGSLKWIWKMTCSKKSKQKEVIFTFKTNQIARDKYEILMEIVKKMKKELQEIKYQNKQLKQKVSENTAIIKVLSDKNNNHEQEINKINKELSEINKELSEIKEKINQIGGKYQVDKNTYSEQFQQLHQKQHQLTDISNQIKAKNQTYQQISHQKIQSMRTGCTQKYQQLQQKQQIRNQNYEKQIKQIKMYVPQFNAKAFNIVWDSTTQYYKNFKVNTNEKKVQALPFSGWAQIVSTEPIPQQGRYLINVRVIQTLSKSIMFGIVTTDVKSSQSSYSNAQSLKYNGYGGQLWYDGTDKGGLVTISNDVLVTVAVDMNEKVILWYLNGAMIVSHPLHQRFIKKRIHFCIEMYNGGDTIQLV